MFEEVDIMFKEAIKSVLRDSIVDAYVTMPSGKEIWDALEAKYGVSNVGDKFYVMQQFHDYRMVDDVL
jgi:hypothetical protein